MTAQPMATVQIPVSVVDAVRAAEAARDAGIAQAEESELSSWNRALIDQAIDAFASDMHRPFSANDLRHLLPDVPSPLMGARFQHAANNRKVIREIGRVKSTKKNTHAKSVGLYIGVPPAALTPRHHRST
jgi:hypothetical protein